MKKIIVCVGISNSGKSTYSAEKVQQNPQEYIRINRDDIRSLLFGYNDLTVAEYYSRPDFMKLEKIVTKYEDTLINEALCEDKTVIIDSTNLHKDYIKRYEYWNVEIELVWFDITLKEALTRNMSRSRKVDESIIEKQYGKYIQLRKDFEFSFSPIIFENDKRNPDVWIFDIDNTIAHMNSRGTFDWKRVGEDIADESVRRLFHIMNIDNYHGENENIIFCSGRDEICREETLTWLENNLGKFNDYKLYMRATNDNRPDWIVKEELWCKIARNYHIIGLIDDRNQVCRRGRALGLKVYQVEYGNF